MRRPGRLLLALLLTCAAGPGGGWADEARFTRETAARWRALDDEAKRFLREGRLALAERYLRRARHAAERLPDGDPRVATALNNLAHVLALRGLLEEAAPLYERGLAAREEIYGPEDLAVAQTAADLGRLRLHQGRFGEALRLLGQAFEAREDALGPAHPLTVETRRALARALHGRYTIDAVEEEADLALALEEADGTQDPPGDLLFALAEAQRSGGRLEAGAATLERAIALVEEAEGPAAAALLPHLNARARLAYELGNLEEAERLTARAAGIVDDGRLADREAVVTLRNRAAVLLALERIDEALRWAQRADRMEAGAAPPQPS